MHTEGVFFIQKVRNLVGRITCNCLDKEFKILVEYDKKAGIENLHQFGEKRVYIQFSYSAKCTKTNTEEEWKGRKWYLSEHMLEDEIVKTCYTAFEAAIKHEIMEGFKVDGKILFNPHINFEKLLEISEEEIKRS